jgi:uncharacterized protein YoaH (UPF0181 family)
MKDEETCESELKKEKLFAYKQERLEELLSQGYTRSEATEIIRRELRQRLLTEEEPEIEIVTEEVEEEDYEEV